MTTKGKIALKIEKIIAACLMMAAASGVAAPMVSVEKAGAEKVTVTIQAGGNAWYLKCLKRNLELSGYFKIGPSGHGIWSESDKCRKDILHRYCPIREPSERLLPHESYRVPLKNCYDP